MSFRSVMYSLFSFPLQAYRYDSPPPPPIYNLLLTKRRTYTHIIKKWALYGKIINLFIANFGQRQVDFLTVNRQVRSEAQRMYCSQLPMDCTEFFFLMLVIMKFQFCHFPLSQACKLQ